MSPEVNIFCEKIEKMARAGVDTGFIDEDIQATLMGMSGRDLDALKPPVATAMTEDRDFLLRLAAYLFGVSPETVRDAPARIGYWAEVAARTNFTVYLGKTLGEHP